MQGNQVNLLDILTPNSTDLEWLVPELWRRAAACYEQVEMQREAAACWAEAGEKSYAADVYLRLDDPAKAAPLLLAVGRYVEALESYRRWLASSPSDDVVGHVTALLGIAASLTLMHTAPEKAQEAYRAARALIEEDTDSGVFESVRQRWTRASIP